MSHPTAFLHSTAFPVRGAAAGTDKEEQVSRYSLYAKLVMAVLVLTMLAMVLGNEPWGPG